MDKGDKYWKSLVRELAVFLEICLVLLGASLTAAVLRTLDSGLFFEAPVAACSLGVIGLVFLMSGALRLAYRFGIWPFKPKAGDVS